MAGVWKSASKRRKFGIITLAILVALALAVWIASIVLRPGYPKPAERTASARAQAKLVGGAKAYTARCAYCHDTGFAPSFAGQGLDGDTIRSFVRTGPGAMPAFPSSQISDAELALIAQYASTLPKPEAKP